METKEIRAIAQKHYDRLFELMRCHEGKRKEGVEPLSWRPRVYIGARKDIDEVLGEVESFLMEHHPGVKIPLRPKILQ